MATIEIPLTEDEERRVAATARGWRCTEGEVLAQFLRYAPGSPTRKSVHMTGTYGMTSNDRLDGGEQVVG